MAWFVVSNSAQQQQIQEYFDEDTDKSCGICDVCVKNRKESDSHAFGNMRREVLRVLKDRTLTIDQIEKYIAPPDRELFVDVVRDLVDDGILQHDSVWKLGIARQKR